MRLSKRVLYAIDDAEAGKMDSALMHACVAVDTTAKRLYPEETRVGARYVQCIRRYYWIIEPMIGAGINLEETTFPNVKLKKVRSPDLAEIIYEKYRCYLTHGDEIPASYMMTPVPGPDQSDWIIGRDQMNVPDRIIWALLALAVFSNANATERSEGEYFLTLGEHRFVIREWWGREDEFRPIADLYNQVRVKMDLDEFARSTPSGDQFEVVQIIQPYATKAANESSLIATLERLSRLIKRV
jgi:hypothetical protein